MTCDKLKRYDLYMLLENGLFNAKMVEKEDGEYFEVNQVRKAFAEHKEDLDALRKENAYLRRLALHALSGWAMGMSMANHYLAKGSRKKQVAYYIFFKKFENLHNIEKDKWRKEKCKK